MLVMRTLHYKDNLISTLTGTWELYIIYNVWGEEYLCGELFFGTFAGVIPCWVL